jgi:hypothetical protein
MRPEQMTQEQSLQQAQAVASVRASALQWVRFLDLFAKPNANR